MWNPWNCFKRNAGGASERQNGTHIYRLSSTCQYHFELNRWTEIYYTWIWISCSFEMGVWGVGGKGGVTVCASRRTREGTDSCENSLSFSSCFQFLISTVMHFTYSQVKAHFFPVFFSFWGVGGGGSWGGGSIKTSLYSLLGCMGTVDTLALKKMTHFPAVAHCHFVELFWFMPHTLEELGITSKPEFYQRGGQSTDNGDMRLVSFRM